MSFEKSKHQALHPGRSADVYLDGDFVGVIGELHPALSQKYGLNHSPVVFELEAEPLLMKGVPFSRQISKFQPVLRDISVVAPSELPVQKLFDAVNKVAKKDPRLMPLNSLSLFDVYEPKESDGQKSLAFSLRLQRLDEHVSDKEADEAVEAVLEFFRREGATLRQ